VQAALYFPEMAAGGVIRQRFNGCPALGLNFTLRMDGFAWMFSMLVLGIGSLVVLYARYYMSPADPVPRFFSFLLAFMGSMSGVVLSGNLIQIVLFWELTSLFSFLLIGYWHHRRDARRGARMALTVTGTGGLCLLAGVLVLGHIVGSYDLDVVLASGEQVRTHALYPVALVLVLLGAFTKSAQFPFHFWLPHAMAAPTPVSAYLHSATMVKAGVFLLARLWPVLAGTDEWFWLVTLTGPGHAADRRLCGHLPERPQKSAGLFDHLAPGPDHHAAGPEQPAGGCGGGVPHPQPRHLQGVALHGGGHHRPRNRHARHPPPVGPVALHADHRHAGHGGQRGHGRGAAAQRLYLQGDVLLRGGVRHRHPWFEHLLPVVATVAGMFSVAYSLRFTVDVFFGPDTCAALPRPARAAALDARAHRAAGAGLPAGGHAARNGRCGAGAGSAATAVVGGVLPEFRPGRVAWPEPAAGDEPGGPGGGWPVLLLRGPMAVHGQFLQRPPAAGPLQRQHSLSPGAGAVDGRQPHAPCACWARSACSRSCCC
jgi:multicomponent K+:H+ antiporter subunit A